jgi:hypothetical protein
VPWDVLLWEVLLFDALASGVAFLDLLAARFGRPAAFLVALRLVLLAALAFLVFALPDLPARLRAPAFFFVFVVDFFAIPHLRSIHSPLHRHWDAESVRCRYR